MMMRRNSSRGSGEGSRLHVLLGDPHPFGQLLEVLEGRDEIPPTPEDCTRGAHRAKGQEDSRMNEGWEHRLEDEGECALGRNCTC
eukprot:3085713-Pyramimonas_sp.AAC.1